MTHKTRFQTILLICVAALLSACQSNPSEDKHGSASTITPDSIAGQSDIGKEFVWGGEVLQVFNHQEHTEITVLSYPLDKKQKPRLRENSSGRFIAIYPGYIEPLDYAPGKHITVTGKLSGFQNGNVSGADYTFPQLSVEKIQLHNRKDRVSFPFSIGVGIGL